MTVLVGNNNFLGYSSGGSNTDGGYVAPAPFVAFSNGSATSLNAFLTPGTATSFQMGLYDGVLQKLVASSVVTNPATGAVIFPIATTPIIAGRAYQILLTGNGTFTFGVSSNSTFSYKVANGQGIPQQLSGPVVTAFGAPAIFVDGDNTGVVLSTSGVYQNLTFNTGEIITRAFDRCRVTRTQISDELIDIAKGELFMLLTNLANGPTPLWAIEQDLFPFTQGLQGVVMPTNTVDVKNVNYRYMNALQQSASTVFAPSSATTIDTLSITWSGPAQPFQLLMGSQVLLNVTPNASAGQTTFYQVDGGVPTSQWSVVGSNIKTVGFYQTLSEVPMYSFSRDEWSQLPQRWFAGTPRQFWFERLVDPVLHLWPVPQIGDQNNACMVVFRHRHVQSIDGLATTIEVPQRWLPAIIDMLAESLGRLSVVDQGLLPILQGYAMKSLALAKGEERERAPFRIIPVIRHYTR